MQRRTPRKFTQEFKAVARNLDLDVSTLRDWVRRANSPPSESSSLTASERQELLQLRKANAVLRMEREILKTTAFFAKESR